LHLTFATVETTPSGGVAAFYLKENFEKPLSFSGGCGIILDEHFG